MKFRKQRIAMLVALVMSTAASFPGIAQVTVPTEQGSMTGQTVILHTNDSHGRAVADEKSGQMGFTAAGALKKAYENAGANVLLLDAGDTLHGLPFATIMRGESIVKIMNQAGYDAMAPGNHDFNYGLDRLVELSKTMKFPLISANLSWKDSGKPVFNNSVTIEKNGVKYGIFGLSTPETAYKTNPKNVSAVTFSDPVEAARKEVAALEAQGVTYIIALAHIGLDESSEFTSDKIAAAVPGIDIIIDGHSHSLLPEGKLQGDTLIASTGDYLGHVGIVTIDANGAKKASLISPEDFTGKDSAIDTITSEIQTGQDQLLSEVVGTTAVELDGLRDHVRTQETNLGNLVADAMRIGTGADVAITNGGGIRSSIPAGNITKKDLVTVFPFGNYVVTKQVQGKAILEALEHGLRAYPESLGGFPQVSGITICFDASKPAGSRVVEAKINGQPLNADEKYLLATNDFMAVGGDDYSMFVSYPISNEFEALEEILISHIKKAGTVSAAIENRIVNISSGQTTSSVYVVEAGDSLWKIAKKCTGDANNWSVIYELNRDMIKTPDRIQVGQQLKIPA